jgi:hypothetical protein
VLLGQLAGELTGGNGFDFYGSGLLCGGSPLGFSLLTNQQMSPILRHFPQDKAGGVQKSAINWGFFDMWGEKPEKWGFSGT